MRRVLTVPASVLALVTGIVLAAAPIQAAGRAAAKPVSAAAGARAGLTDSHQAPAPSGAQLWVQRYQSPGGHFSSGHSVAVSPDGRTVFVTGESFTAHSVDSYATVAYSTATGAKRWVSHYRGPGFGPDYAVAVVVSPGGRRVFVTGASAGPETNDYATVAYNAATGAQLWVRRYNGPGNGDDDAQSMAVSPGGRTVYVTGLSGGTTTLDDYATVAYSAATGAPQWVRRYNGPGNGSDFASAVTVSPDGRKVFVTGSSFGANSAYDYATVAYSAATGAQLWVRRYSDLGPSNEAAAYTVAASKQAVFVTGHSLGHSGDNYVTVAYSAATGAQLWLKAYNGPGRNYDDAYAVAVSPDGGTVYVTGASFGGTATLADYGTVAYNAFDGTQLWVSRYNGPASLSDVAHSIAVSPDGKKVFVTGQSRGPSGWDYATVAYMAATGGQLWAKRYDGPVHGNDYAFWVAVSPHGDRVFVTGQSRGPSGPEYATIAYRS